ncbi:NAD(P)H-dependent oxidoreductase [Chengkuizengella sp. SCS-71B]|uniref:NAD(P)H-dependent oxidoreductase n=1 Tax=Chengkuizengella sp. SCS-71B TaxID=3115290 RepID=UPI0032C212E9
MKKVLIINGNPNEDSFGTALASAYKTGASKKGAEVKKLRVADLIFDPIYKGYTYDRKDLEDDLMKAQELITWADHLVFIYPNWWGTMPALLKGFIDRVFLPGFAFKYKENSAMVDQLLTEKTARLIVTMDSPKWYYTLFQGKPGHNSMKKSILNFCGIKPVKITSVDQVRKSTVKRKRKWLSKIEKLGYQVS